MKPCKFYDMLINAQYFDYCFDSVIVIKLLFANS